MTASMRRKSNRSSKPSTIRRLPSEIDSSLKARERDQTAAHQNSLPSPQTQVKREPHSPLADLLPAPDIEPAVEILYGWQHPAELEYITPEDWPSSKIILHLITNSFSIPPRAPSKSANSVFTVTSVNGQTTTLPIGYRVPLLFFGKFQWLSLKVVLTATSRETEWSEYKFSILHVCRLCTALLSSAQEYVRFANDDVISMGMDRKWRCPTFDRALARFRLKWFLSNPAQVQEFWETYQEEEYKKDVLKFDWRRWAIKGHKGFELTEYEITNGISAENFMRGLKLEGGEWQWETNDNPLPDGIDAWLCRDLTRVSTPPSPQPASTFAQTSLIAPSPINAVSSEEHPADTAANNSPNLAIAVSASSSVSSHSNGRIVDATLQEIVPHDSVASQQPETLPPLSSNAGNKFTSHLNGNHSHAVSPKLPTSQPTVPRLKIIPQKRPGSPLEKDPYASVRISGARSRSTPLSLPLKGSKSANCGTSVEEGVNSGSVPPNSDRAYRRRRSLPIPKGREKHISSSLSSSTVQRLDTSITKPPDVPPSSFSSIQTQQISEAPASSILPVPSSASASPSSFLSNANPTPVPHPPPPPPPISAKDILPLAATHLIEDRIRDIVRFEVQNAMQNSLNSLREDVVKANQREVRDGVRIIVAAMREEFVADMEKRYRELGNLLIQLRDRNGQISQRVQSVRKALRAMAMAPRTVPASGSASTLVPGPSDRRFKSLPLIDNQVESLPSLTQQLSHPLQHLLGEPDPFADDDDYFDDDDWEGDYDLGYPDPKPDLDLESPRQRDRSEDADESVHMDVDFNEISSAQVRILSTAGEGADEVDSSCTRFSNINQTYPIPSSVTF
ncbi:hypothetical protein GYMLUDRAFT_47026 [Collybiopsis luxurians FD-317 M1]|uniref:Uncharacterized protein n=1 Tax=Collybiopsis luxurians FD-317 M1 TaxID=944289 RepID=A0A0D0CEP1_9AGAR|nr:hypothetical protein GYMLUDRAFT_47026 [Collybiopsis luxurians FD-317 M1]